MRTLHRNKSIIHYANYKGKEQIMINGKATGQYKVTYEEPVTLLAYVSAGNGSASAEIFGVNESYDKVIILDEPNIEINEAAVVWVEQAVVDPYDYVVKKVVKSINSISIGITKVKVNG